MKEEEINSGNEKNNKSEINNECQQSNNINDQSININNNSEIIILLKNGIGNDDIFNKINENNKEKKERYLNKKEENIPKKDINDISEETISKFKQKVHKLKSSYQFSIFYHDSACNFINYLNELIYERIQNSIIDNKNYINFFNNICHYYSFISNNLKDIQLNLPKINDNIFKDTIQDLKDLIRINFSENSDTLKRSIESTVYKIKEKEKEIENIKTENNKKLNEINETKIKLKNKFLITYNKLFISEIKSTNLSELPDLVIASKDLLKDINDIISGVNSFIKNTKESLITLNNILNEINKFVKDTIIIYIKDNKNGFNKDAIKKIEIIEKKLKTFGEKPEDQFLKFTQLLDSPLKINKIGSLLVDYLISLGIFQKSNPNNNPILIIEKYKNIDSFFNFIISKNPKIIYLNNDDLITKKMEIQIDPGFLKSWKDCLILFTVQKHLIACEKTEIYSPENIIQVFQMDKIDFKLNPNFEKYFIFEISPKNNEGLLKKYYTYSFDALNNNNLYELILMFKDYS